MKRRRLPSGVPNVLKFGNVSFDVFATKDRRVDFRYKLSSKWEQCIRRPIVDLKSDAERIVNRANRTIEAASSSR